MKQSSREIVKMLAIGFVVMMALPVGYRIYRATHPAPEPPRRTLAQFFEQSAEDRAVRLLQTPPAKWTDYDKRSEPQIFAWLEAHNKIILPWEWSEQARQKDPDGYRKLWQKLFKEQERELSARLKAEQKKLKALERDIWINETLHTHHTNQLALVESYIATNTFPMTVTLERLSKGRFWGWNRKAERITFQKPESAAEWRQNELKSIAKFSDEIHSNRRTRELSATQKECLEALCHKSEATALSLKDRGKSSVDGLVQDLTTLLRNSDVRRKDNS